MAPEPRLGPPQTRVDVPLCHPQEKERLRAEAEAKEKYNRLALFESDLQLLGVSLDEAVELDEKGLRKARARPTPPPPPASSPTHPARSAFRSRAELPRAAARRRRSATARACCTPTCARSARPRSWRACRACMSSTRPSKPSASCCRARRRARRRARAAPFVVAADETKVHRGTRPRRV